MLSLEDTKQMTLPIKPVISASERLLSLLLIKYGG
jgi:hypothetical protein